MSFILISYISILSFIFFKRDTFIYIILSICILLGYYYINDTLLNIKIQDVWFLFILTCTYYLVLEVSKDSTKDVQFLKFLIWLGSSIIITSSHLILIYIGLELQTFSLFVLIAKNRGFIKSSEAGLKYFILGALSSGFFLISIITFYHLYHTLNLFNLFIIYNGEFSFYILMFILSLSLFFKLSLFPLHFWIPDIYEGSSADIISIIATLPKISVLAFVLKLNLPSSFLLYTGLLSIFIGCLGGLNQTKIKRLLAYSSIAHLGFTIVGLSLFGKVSIDLALIYFLIYIISSLGLLFLLIEYVNKEDVYIIEFSGLQFSSKWWSLFWLIFFLSLAGLPPLFGFIGKWWIITNLINVNYYIISIIIIILSCISIAFYLRIGKIIYFQKSSSYSIWYSALKPKKANYISFYIITCSIYISLFSIIIPNTWSCLTYTLWL